MISFGLFQGTPVNIIVGSHIWVEDPQVAWIDGEVTEIKGKDASIVTTNGKKIVANLSSIYPKDTEAPPAGVDDMTKLAYLHEPGVLQNLASRFALNEIYVSFNSSPVTTYLKPTYTGNILIAVNPFQRLPHLYDTHMMQQYKGATFGELSPHLFAVADACYRSIINEHGNQSILVSGESGAGKTETTKMLMRYLAFMGGRSGTEGRTVEQQVLEDVKKYKLENPRNFHYLNQTSCYEVANVDDAREYLETRNAMDVVGISQEEQDAIFSVVAAILHLGNIDFVKGKEIDSSKLKNDKSLYHLQTVAELLKCDAKQLEDSLTKRVIVTPDGDIIKLLDPDSAASNRDALAKTVYSRLFDWIVDKINRSIGQDPNAASLIGVLDIYGFESFKVNSFEQLCINLTNEKLQQHFNQHVFKMEQEEYEKEEINWSYVEFVDNQDVLDLIEKKPGGIIALLDEACMFPKSTHETFAQKLYQTYKNNKRFSKPKTSRTNFTINHYAGDVTYQADYFLDKNKDYVVAEHQALLDASSCPFVANLFPKLAEDSSKQSKFSSIGTRFKQQLQSLMETLSTTEPHYIRCVKPNGVLKPGIFENFNVLNQLRCGGVLEAIRISCAGYPTKRTFDEFLDRFGTLAPDLLERSDEKEACASLCDRMGLKGYQIGKTKVFLRAGQMAELDARRAEVVANAARLIQRQIRTYLARKEFIKIRRATMRFQKLWRGLVARKLYEEMRREAASICLQKYARAHRARKAYKQLRASAVVIQTGMRAMAARNEYRHRRRTKASIIVQTRWRSHKALTSYKQKQVATLTLQCLWRGRTGRKELRKLRMAARDAGALREAKDKLEKRVEELSWRLDLEKKLRVDLEEAKGHEIAKLQTALHEMQGKVDEANAAIISEKEAARIAIEQAPPVIKEVPVVDNTALELLTNRNEILEGELSELKIKTEDIERRYYEIQKDTEVKEIEATELQSKLSQLQETIERLEVSLSNLESENQVLRQQALEASKSDDLSEELKILEDKIAKLELESEMLQNQAPVVVQQIVSTEVATYPPATNQAPVVEQQIVSPEVATYTPVTKSLENGHQTEEEFKTPKEKEHVRTPLTKQKSLTDRQQENHDALIKCLVEDKRFEKNRPVAACIVYRALLQWRSFEADKTHIFDRIIHIIRDSVEDQENVNELAYWLSTTSALLFLIQNTIKACNSPINAAHRSRASPTTLFGRMAQGLRTSPISSGYSGMVGKPEKSKVEAKYPALLFKQHLTAYVEKIYGMIRDSLKKEISPFLNLCIQAPRSTRARSLRGASKNMHSNIVAKQQVSSIHWQSIVKCMDHTWNILRENNVPSVIIRKTFTQVFAFINVQLLNSLVLFNAVYCFAVSAAHLATENMLKPVCRNWNNGVPKQQIRQANNFLTKSVLETYFNQRRKNYSIFIFMLQYTGSAWNELQHIRQAVGFLVSHQKPTKTLEEITAELCPALSIPQIYRIGTMFWDDKYGTQGLSQDIIAKMRVLMTEDSINMPNNNNSFLLDVDSSIPFSLEELSRSFLEMSPSDIIVEPPPLLRQNSEFHFLLQRTD
ncbi:hypothetical protein C5167_002019 [Papaver somniferum]|uniref:Myosin motor domain-containing protein n=1 Tax=Papaver somniferum TaxID=3469 RepID=A0A4Y7KYB4_PAPSO|nr:hypothetical protein C5167_002019 [Papaver somniferum]